MGDLDFIERVTVLYLWKAEQCHRHRRPWVDQVLQRRNPFGEYQHVLQELRLDDGRFQRYLRLSRTQFEDLLSRVGGQISPWDTNYRRCIPAAECLSIYLW
ncbi:hypothetical protein ILYODFUR_038759 [Ilyodon furcidens]|uniref:Uncharacterized protein n=1 Tax=Ilyodon furcidens TaxID=33524 RepID=A0ABV0T3V0_9TELE